MPEPTDYGSPPTRQMMEIFQFDESDLAANREGRLGESQLARQRARFGATTASMLVAGAGLVALAGLGVAILNTAENQGDDPATLQLVAVIIIAFAVMMFLFVAGSSFSSWQRERRAVTEGVVSSVEGTIALKRFGRKFVSITVTDDSGESHRFGARRTVMQVLHNRMRCRLYVIPTTNKLVSVEILDG